MKLIMYLKFNNNKLAKEYYEKLKEKCQYYFWIIFRQQKKLPRGLEPLTYALRMRRSTNWATEAE